VTEMFDNILITGGSGRLGSEILSINNKIQAPRSCEFDVSNIELMSYYLLNNNVDLIINCAAITDTVYCEKNVSKALYVNTAGPINLVALQEMYKFKLVHISTDYVFDGEKGDYKVTDSINPISNYSKSKAAGELAVRMSKNSLVIRTSFFPKKFPHNKAFIDQYTTKDFVDIIAPKIYELAISDKTGVVHVGTKKDSVFNKVRSRKSNIEEMSREEIKSVFIPKDVSLI